MAVKLKTISIVQWKIERSKMSTAKFVFAITVSLLNHLTASLMILQRHYLDFNETDLNVDMLRHHVEPINQSF